MWVSSDEFSRINKIYQHAIDKQSQIFTPKFPSKSTPQKYRSSSHIHKAFLWGLSIIVLDFRGVLLVWVVDVYSVRDILSFSLNIFIYIYIYICAQTTPENPKLMRRGNFENVLCVSRKCVYFICAQRESIYMYILCYLHHGRFRVGLKYEFSRFAVENWIKW